MSESRQGPGAPELQAGIRIVADLTGSGNATPEAVVTAADATGRPTELLTGIPAALEAAPVLSPDAPAGARPIMARALLVDPGTKVEQAGTLKRPARVRGLSTLVRQKGGGDGPLDHVWRVVEKRLAFLATDPEVEGGGGWLAFLGPGGALTRFADVLTPLQGAGRGTVAGIRTDALFGATGALTGKGWPLAFSPASRGEDTGGSRISRGWLAVGPGGDWCPETPIPDEIPPEEPPGTPGGGNPPPPPPPGGGGQKGDKGDKGKDGRNGKQGKNGPPLDPLDPENDPHPDDPGTDEEEIIRCDLPQPEEPPATPPREESTSTPPAGTVAARMRSDALGRTRIQPKEPGDLWTGDIRKHLGGGVYMRRAPLVPPGGIRLATARDFAVGNTTWDALNFAFDKINQLISFVSARLPGAPTVTDHGALFLPTQDVAAARLEQFDDGTIVMGSLAHLETTRARERTPTPHILWRDRSGKRVLSPITPDRAASRTIGSGERGADVELRFLTGYPEHRSRGDQPKIVWDGRRKLFSVQGADYEVEALVVTAADSSTTKIETTESTGAVTLKSTPAGGTEITRTMPPRTGEVLQCDSALAEESIPRVGPSGNMIASGLGDTGSMIESARSLKLAIGFLPSIAVDTINSTVTLDSGAQTFLHYTPSGASRDVVLPPEAVGEAGLVYMIRNAGTSGFDVVVKDDGGATLATLGDGEWTWVQSDGSQWYAWGLF